MTMTSSTDLDTALDLKRRLDRGTDYRYRNLHHDRRTQDATMRWLARRDEYLEALEPLCTQPDRESRKQQLEQRLERGYQMQPNDAWSADQIDEQFAALVTEYEIWSDAVNGLEATRANLERRNRLLEAAWLKRSTG